MFLSALVYFPVLGAPLIWDDVGTILHNQDLSPAPPLASYVQPGYFSFSREQTWRPMATLSYSAGIALAGKGPLALRLCGLLLHWAAGGLLALVLAALGLPAATAALAGALFLVHPVHIETLMCVSFNEELLAAVGVLGMLWAHRTGRAAAAAAGYAFALLSKESGVIGLPLVLACDRLERRRPRWGAYAAYGAALAAYLWMRFVQLPGPAAEAGLSLPWGERLYFALAGLAAAARACVWPVSLRIEYFALPAESLGQWLSVSAAAAAALAAAGWAGRTLWKRDRRLVLFVVWPFLFLALTSNLLPVNVLSLRLMAERWLYLPLLGLCALAAWGLAARPRAAAAVLVFWTAAGIWRAQDWRDDARLWESLLRIYPWCAKAQEGRGEGLYHQRRYPEALAAFEKALDLRQRRQDKVLAHYVPLAPPGLLAWESPSLRRWLGLAYLKNGDAARAEESFKAAFALDASSVFACRVLAYLSAAGGRWNEAREWIARGLGRNPNDDFLKRLRADAGRRRLSFAASFD